MFLNGLLTKQKVAFLVLGSLLAACVKVTCVSYNLMLPDLAAFLMNVSYG